MKRVKDSETIPALISRLHEKSNTLLRRELAVQGLQGLVPSHGSILYALALNEKLTMTEVADFAQKKKSTVTILVEKLITQGYVRKTRDTQDNRVFYLSLTRKGRALQEPVEKISQKLNATLSQNLSKRESQQLAQLLIKIDDGW